jgi:hypothetical protein
VADLAAVVARLEDNPRMHGTDERIAVADHEEAVRPYRQLILDIARTTDTLEEGINRFARKPSARS